MQKTALLALLALIGSAALTGCATNTTKETAQENQPVEEAPLGSRIKRRTNINPTAGVSREDIENGRVQDAARAVGAVTNPGKYAN